MMSASTGGLLVSFGGHTLKVISDSPQIFTAMQTHLRHCPTPQNGGQTELIVEFNITASAESKFTVTADDDVVFSNLNYDHTLQLLMTELISRLVAVCESGLIIHAAALAHKGDAVILSAQGGSGKSTLAAQLTRDGLQYMTDEVIEIPLDAQSSTFNFQPSTFAPSRAPSSSSAARPSSGRIESPKPIRPASFVFQTTRRGLTRNSSTRMNQSPPQRRASCSFRATSPTRRFKPKN